jgi:hypothetical protein
VKVKVSATGSYAYTDVAALCGAPTFEHGESGILLNPQLLIEVLSESTERYDRGSSCAQTKVFANTCTFRSPSAAWNAMRVAQMKSGYSDVTDPEGAIDLASMACRLSVARIYKRNFFKA